MNYSCTKNEKRILFSINKKSKNPDSYSGWFLYSSKKGNYLSSNIEGKDDWTVMKKLFFQATREIPKCYNENIEDMTGECWTKFFNSKQKLLQF